MPRRLVFAQLSVRKQPLVYFAVAFMCGEMIAARVPTLLSKTWGVSAIILFATALLIFFGKRFLWRPDFIITLVLLANASAVGGLLYTQSESIIAESRIKKIFEREGIKADEPVEIWGVVMAAPELAPDRIYLDIAIEKISTFGKEQNASGTVRVIVPVKEAQDRADYDALALDYGAQIRALALLRKSEGFRNPGATNFAEMLEFRGYDANGQIKSALLIERINTASHWRILKFLYGIRANAIAVILRSFTQPTAGILSAALFGNQYFLSQETADSFRIGGTFHLLVISGLHVAMLALVVAWLTVKIFRSRWLRFVLMVALLWAYTLMIGAQPAITRASVMLTFVLIGQLFYRTAPGANTLAASALVLLAWQPRNIFNPGFQLSFATVLMIVLVTVPLLDRIRHIGEWQPSVLTPYPPRVPFWLKWCAEVLHWNEAEFQDEMSKTPIRFRLEKVRVAKWVSATKWRHRAQKIIAWIFITILSTTVVQIGLLPLMIANFHRVSFVSPITNALQGAFMFLLMVAGAAYLLLHAVCGAIVGTLAIFVNGIGWLTANSANKLLLWRKLNFRVPDYGAEASWIYAIYFVLVLVLIVALSLWNPLSLYRRGVEETQRKYKGFQNFACYFCGFSLLVLLGVLVLHPTQHKFETGRLSITFLDVGQGDAMLISFPNGKLMLLDSGGRIPTDLATIEGENIFVEDRVSIGEAAVSPFLWQLGIKRLDYIAASHGHSDHTQGFEDIGKSFAIDTALTGVIPTNDQQFAAFSQAANFAGAPIKSISRGDKLEIDGVKVEALTPFRDALKAEQCANNQSLTLRLRFGKRTFLLTGDIEKEIETRLVAENENLKTDVLKVAHHGSRSSSTLEFLQRAQPQYAVISVAHPSPFDHPHKESLEGLQRIGAQILQTSKCGAITISTDGEDLQVKTFVKCE